jgi:hypothetical protein
MFQQSIVYVLLSGAIIYVSIRFYSSIKKKEACGKCELMKAAKADGLKKQNS